MCFLRPKEFDLEQASDSENYLDASFDQWEYVDDMGGVDESDKPVLNERKIKPKIDTSVI